MRLSITIKLLLFVLPLVCIPIAIVGYLSYKTSVESVTRLSRNEQMLQAKAAATEINAIFQFCCRDLETMARFLLNDPQVIEPFSSQGMKGTEREKIVELFQDFLSRSPYYIQIHLIDSLGREAVFPLLEGRYGDASGPSEETLMKGNAGEGEQDCSVSRINYSVLHHDFIVRLSKPLINRDHKDVGKLVMDLDFGKVIGLVKAIRVGNEGFAFLVDQFGRTIAHPQFKPYEYDFRRYEDARLREFVVDMITGETGSATYYHFGEKAAAFAPVPATGWSLAVSIPIDEFKKEAKAIRTRVFQLVVAMLILAGLGVGILSYQLLRPVKRLVLATEKMALGDLEHEIPIRTRDELGTLTRSFNHMVRNLREIQSELIRSEKLISMGRLSAGIAHEVRNPLNAMKGAIIYLQECCQENVLIQEYTQLILEEINRLNNFVTEFLFFAKQSTPQREPTDFNKFFESIKNFLKKEFTEKGIKVLISLYPAMPLIHMDPHQMEQVFLNLLVNAMHAMPEGGVLECSSSIENGVQDHGLGPRAVIKIRDEGAGIPKDQMDAIFDPFFSTKGDGTGLGLPISLGIVENHGGRMEISSEEGKGTTVTVVLPIGNS